MRFARYWEKVILSIKDSPSKKFFNKQITVWGASNESVDDAVNHAELRAQNFKKVLNNGFKSFAEYQYFNGYIREQVLEEIHSDSNLLLGVLTRNHYGAKVLNSENVFFGDIDSKDQGLTNKFLSLFGRKLKDKDY